MTTLYIESAQKPDQIYQLVRAAIEGKIKRIELALAMANKRLAPFEQKYNVTSQTFIEEMAAEDLDGGDDEYVNWAGEYALMQRLQEKLRQLQEIDYGDSRLLRTDQSHD